MTGPRRLLCPELIGREGEMVTLEAALDRGSRVRSLLVAGDAGVGKSALLRHFVDRVKKRGGRALVGECTEIEARRPFGPFIGILRQVAHEPAARRIGPALRGRLSPLVTLLPELLPEAHAGSEQGGDRFRIYDAFVDLLSGAPQWDVRLAAVEDLHWADEASLELFAYLARRLPEGGVALIGSYRSDELHRTHPLQPVLVGMERARTAEVVRLGPLDREGSDRVVRATLGTRAVPPDLLETIWERCQGNTFFIEETLKSLVEEGHLRAEDRTWRWSHPLASAVPASVRDAVQLRLARLAPETLRLLRVAAVIGQRFDLVLLQRAADASDTDIATALRDLVVAQLIDEALDSGPDAYVFRHALTREAVLAEVLGRDRRELHRRIATAIEAETGEPNLGAAHQIASSAIAASMELRARDPRDGRVEELAYHFDEAGDVARAHHYHVRAGAVAARSVAAVRAIRHLERAIELAPADPVVLARLYMALAHANATALDWQRGYEAAERGRDQHAIAGNRAGVGNAIGFMSYFLFFFGPRERAHALLRESLEILEPLGPSVALANTLVHMAILSLMDGDVMAALDTAVRAEKMTRDATEGVSAEAVATPEPNDRRVRGQVLATLAAAMAAKGSPDAVAAAREAVEFAVRTKADDVLHRAYSTLRDVLMLTGASHAERDRVFGEQLEHARETGYRNRMFIEAQLQRAFAQADWDDALERAAELSVTAGSIFEAWARLYAAVVTAARDDPAAGVALVEPAVGALLDRTSAWDGRAASVGALVHLVAGDARAALDVAERVHAIAGRWLPGEILALAILVAPDDASAATWSARIPRATGALEPRTAEAPRVVAAAVAARGAGRTDEALRLLGEAADLLRDEQLPQYETFVRIRRAELLAERGESDAASAEMAGVLPFWRKARAERFLQRLRGWARDHRIRLEGTEIPAAPRSRALALTPREREVAGLVAQGLTNRQIAKQLVISERTAETHVEQIRSKLGFRNRAQIAGWVAQNP